MSKTKFLILSAAFFTSALFLLPQNAFALSLPPWAPPITWIEEDVTWTKADSPYIFDVVLIDPFSKLTIEPGTVVKFRPGGGIAVFGELEARGSETQKIIFTSEKDDIGGDTNADGNATVPAPGDWVGILAAPGSRTNLEHATITYGGYFPYPIKEIDALLPDYIYKFPQEISNETAPINIGALTTDAGEITGNDLQISNNNRGVQAFHGSINITNSEISGNQEYGAINASYNAPLNLTNNFWGDNTGPYHPSLNPSGLGDRISNNINFIPWLTRAAREPVILIPGITGSWDIGRGLELDPIFNTYDNLWTAFQEAGYEKDKNLFAFPYHWRESNIYTAQHLKEKIQEIKEICKCEKVDIVAHSMGSLVAREYIESNYYQGDIDQVIFLGAPHQGAPKAYLSWEGGDIGFGPKDSVLEKIFTLEAKFYGYDTLFEYIRGRPILSVKELLPIFDYLKDADTGTMREYPNNYPRNEFLESLNSKKRLNKLKERVRVTNIVGDLGKDDTINVLRVVEKQDKKGKWKHGYPENYNIPFTDHGLEYGRGDLTVPLRAHDIFFENNFENIVLQEEHRALPTMAQQIIIEKLTGTKPDKLFKKNLFSKWFLIRVFSPVNFLVIGPNGKKLGKDFESNEIINEIENAFYFENPEFAIIPEPLDGEYRIQVQGTDTGNYTLSASYIDDENEIDKDLSGYTVPGRSDEFKVNLDLKNPEEILSLKSTATFEDLINDINFCFEQGWIKKQNIKNTLIQQVQHTEKWYNKLEKIKEKAGQEKAKNVIKATQEKQFLRQFKNLVNNLEKQGNITPETKELLLNQANNIINNLLE